MTNLWLFGTIIPLAVIAYIFIVRMIMRWAMGRWEIGRRDDVGLVTMFAIFWPLTVFLWALFTFMLIPMWHTWDGLGDKMEELGAKHKPEEE